tara:strand:- start:45 stop:821 length:777 start_codon:yes stop_codon:yes gene_type:complete
MEIYRCYDPFITDRKISGCSEATLRIYDYVIGKLLRYIRENDLDLSVESIHHHILPFFSHLQQRDPSASTYHTLFRGLRAFTRFLHQEGYVKDEIRLPKVKQPHTTISPLNPCQMKAIVHSFDTKTYLGMRNYTIIRLFLDTCVRLSELSQLQLADVTLEEGFVLVHGKGAKNRYVPIGRSTIKCLWNYIKKRAVIDVNTNAYLFLTQRGTALSARGVQFVFRSLKKTLNLDGRKLSPHLLRHSFALANIENGGDPFS